MVRLIFGTADMLLGSRVLALAAIGHQATYAIAPLALEWMGWPMPGELYGDAAKLPINAWAPFFIIAHGLAALFIATSSFLSGALATLAASMGYLALASFAKDAPFGAVVQVWSISPNMAQNLSLSVMLTLEAINRRQARL